MVLKQHILPDKKLNWMDWNDVIVLPLNDEAKKDWRNWMLSVDPLKTPGEWINNPDENMVSYC